MAVSVCGGEPFGDALRRGGRAWTAGLGGLALVVLVAVPSAGAADCESAQTTVEMVDCADADFRSADETLNETYRATMDTLRGVDADAGDGSDRTGKLRTAQRSWLRLRDEQCALEAAYAYGGTLAPVLEIECRARMTAERTETLRRVAEAYSDQ